MERWKLPNGVTILYKKTPSKSVAIEAMVSIGSNHEQKSLLGISHLIEHMLFEGTKKRATSMDITNEIERLGGDFNAYTTTDRTAYHIKVLAKHIDRALDVIADMILNPVFNEKMIEKEKKVILKEIHMVMDDPRFYQWVLFQKSLFKEHPAKNPTYGTVQTVKKLSRDDLLEYYCKHYTAKNLIIAVAGGVSSPFARIEKYFGSMNSAAQTKPSFSEEPPNEKPEVFAEKKKTLSAYMVLGYKIPSRIHEDTYALDVIAAILGKGQSGRIFNEVRNKRGLAYEVGVNCEPATDHGFFAVHISTNKENLKLSKKIIMGEFRKLENVSEKELNEAKGFIEGNHLLQIENTQKLADGVCFWELIKDAKLAESYVRKIKSVTVDDVAGAASKYLNENYTMAVIEPK